MRAREVATGYEFTCAWSPDAGAFVAGVRGFPFIQAEGSTRRKAVAEAKFELADALAGGAECGE